MCKWWHPCPVLLGLLTRHQPRLSAKGGPEHGQMLPPSCRRLSSASNASHADKQRVSSRHSRQSHPTPRELSAGGAHAFAYNGRRNGGCAAISCLSMHASNQPRLPRHAAKCSAHFELLLVVKIRQPGGSLFSTSACSRGTERFALELLASFISATPAQSGSFPRTLSIGTAHAHNVEMQACGASTTNLNWFCCSFVSGMPVTDAVKR